MIRFGTDGWRGIISDTFTFENVRIASQGLADMINSDPSLPKAIAVGYDRRFLSDEFAGEVCKVMAANGIGVQLADAFLPTPVLSWAAKNVDGLAGAVVITASHNPYYYNGFKFKERLGCSAFPETTLKIEAQIRDVVSGKGRIKMASSVEDCLKNGSVKYFNPFPEYAGALERFIDRGALKTLKERIIVDPMNGSGSGYLASVIRSLGVEAEEIHAERDPMFGGVNPEPIEENLKETISVCRGTRPLMAIVLDGDSDRIGAVDENGEFFNTQQVYSLVAWDFLRHGSGGAIGKTVSTTHTIDRLAEKYGAKVVETPIGFKHLAKKMIEKEIAIGGEESGGIGLSAHLPERDPLLVSLLLLCIVAREGRGLSRIYEELSREVGYASFQRRDYMITAEVRDDINKKLKSNPPSSFGGKKARDICTLDGYKFLFSDESWVLIRTSGTEAVLRIYAETKSKDESLKLIEEAEKTVKYRS